MDDPKKSRVKRLRTFLGRKYRLVILNDNTFAENLSLRMSPLGLITGILAITIIMTTLVISLVAFTPLREYIPGYGSISERKAILRLTMAADSMEEAIVRRDIYLSSILRTINEDGETAPSKPVKDTTGKYKQIKTAPSETDIQFRKAYEQSRTSTQSGIAHLRYKVLSDFVFYPPVKGLVTSNFSIQDEHPGIDIVAKADEPVKSTLGGTIIFTGFSVSDGNVIQVQHNNNLISIYKHCASVMKSPGDHVKAGEAIAVVGNTGERSSGPHLHFELWFNGTPINPQEFVAF